MVSDETSKEGNNSLLEAYISDGKMINSEFLDGLNISEAKEKIIREIETKGIGEEKLFSDLKIGAYLDKDIGDVDTMIYLEDGTIIPVDKSELPVELPIDIDLKCKGSFR